MNHQPAMSLRRPWIAVPKQIDPVLLEGNPEPPSLLVGPSLSLPYAEPYLIRTPSKAKRRVADPKLRETISLVDGEEAQQVRLHVRFDKATGEGGPARSELEAELALDFEQNLPTRSLKWNLAY